MIPQGRDCYNYTVLQRPSERRAVFDQFVRYRAEEERKEKKAKARVSRIMSRGLITVPRF